jgi:hypothetical protein
MIPRCIGTVTIMANKQTGNIPGPGPGRPKGSPNRITKALKDAIILAAEEAGYDGQGQDGLVGYLKHVADTDVKAFCGLLGRVLPMQVPGDDDGAITVVIQRFAEEQHVQH